MSFECDKCQSNVEVEMLGMIGTWKTDRCDINELIELETLCRKCLLSSFSELISTMDLPEMRRKDYRWLNRNMGIRNSNHDDYEQASFYLRAILRD